MAVKRNVDDTLTWICDECGEPGGLLHVDRTEARQRVVEARDAGDITIDAESMAEYLKNPPPRWQVHHGDCRPDDRGGLDYEIPSHEIDTMPKLVHWTGHLMGKMWLPGTDWDRILLDLGDNV